MIRALDYLREVIEEDGEVMSIDSDVHVHEDLLPLCGLPCSHCRERFLLSLALRVHNTDKESESCRNELNVVS